MAYETLIVEVKEHVGLVRLNRPDALNALSSQLLGELAEALTTLDANDMVGAIVLTGSDKAFAAGADIKEMSEKSFVDMFTTNYFAPETDAIGRVRKPIIAAVAGYALGGGCELAMMCDFIIAADTAKFGQPEINLLATAGKIADKSPIAVMATKEAVNRSYELTLSEGVLFERRMFYSLFATEDQTEGMAAFAEKRTPKFRGH